MLWQFCYLCHFYCKQIFNTNSNYIFLSNRTLYLHVTTKQVAMTEYNEILEEVGEDHHNPDNF